MAARKKGEPPNQRRTMNKASTKRNPDMETPLAKKRREKKAKQRMNSRTVDKGNPKSARNLGTRVVGITSDGKKVYNYRGR